MFFFLVFVYYIVTNSMNSNSNYIAMVHSAFYYNLYIITYIYLVEGQATFSSLSGESGASLDRDIEANGEGYVSGESGNIFSDRPSTSDDGGNMLHV